MDVSRNGRSTAPPDLLDAPHLTDQGNAQRLVREHGAQLRYVPAWHRFLVYDGKRWLLDELGVVERFAKATVASLFDEVLLHDDDPKARRAFAEWALRSESEPRLRAMINLAQTEPGIAVLPNDLDADRMLLNLANCTFDLRRREPRPHDPADLCTQLAPVNYDPNAECPRWMKFMGQIFAGNGNLISFMQRAIGYALTGDTSEHVVFILWGSGANGKSTLLNTIVAMLGTCQPRDYAVTTRAETFMVKKGDTIPNDVAALHNARMVVASEADRERRLAEGMLKNCTGGDPVNARFMRAEFFSFVPRFKVFLATNQRPIVRGTDHGLWRRIRLIPFNVTIPPADQDPYLADALKAELPGILRWAIQGCFDWQDERLGYPSEVRAATDAYRRDMDVIGDFITERCLVAAGEEITSKELYDAYTGWARDDGEKVLSAKSFGLYLQERGIQPHRSKKSRGWLGIRLRMVTDPDPGDAMTRGDAFSYIDYSARARMGNNGSDASHASPVTQDDVPDWVR
jgi:putative DNA primase/helicase